MNNSLVLYQDVPTVDNIYVVTDLDLQKRIEQTLRQIIAFNFKGHEMSEEEIGATVSFIYNLRRRMKAVVSIGFLLEETYGHNRICDFDLLLRFRYQNHYYRTKRPIDELHGRHSFVPKEVIAKLLCQEVTLAFAEAVFLEAVNWD